MRQRLAATVAKAGPYVVLLLATIGYFWRILFTTDAWKPAGGGDLVSFLFPAYRFAAAQLQSGHLPLWNPFQYGGAPFLADMQTGVFYPPNLLLFLLNPGFSYKTMEVLAVLHVFLAGVSMFLFLRYSEPGQRLRTHAALFGAVAFMFSDLFVVHFGNLNLIAVTAWLPLVALLFWRSLRSRRLGLAVAAGVALGIATLAGHLQITLYIAVGLAVATAVNAIQSRHKERGWAWSLLTLAIAGGVAIGLCAMVLLPALQFAQLSPRASLSYENAARYSLIPALLGELLVPALFSSAEPSLYWGVWDRVAAGYLGVFSLILAGLAILLRRGRRTGFLVALACLGFLLALGGQSVIHGWAYLLIPGFRQIRAPARIVIFVDFGLAALAALGLDRLLAPLEPRARRLFSRAYHWLLGLFGLAAVVGAAWAYLVLFQAQDRDPTLFWRVSWASNGVIWALLLLATGLAWLSARRAGRLGRRMLGWLAVALVFVDLASFGAYSDLGNTPPDKGFNHQLAVDYMKSDSGWFRIDSDTDVTHVWQPDLAETAGLYDASGVDNPLLIADMVRYMEGTGGRSTQLYDLMGVRYVIASKGVTLDWAKFTLAYDGDQTVNVYRNETALPRAFVAFQAEAVADQESAWNRIHETGIDLASKVILEGGSSQENLEVKGQASVEVRRHEAGTLEFQVESPADGYLVVSDPYYPGWEATVDGEQASILRADYAFRAVAVPAGSHRVAMDFRPATWRVGLALTIATWLAVLLVAALSFSGCWRKHLAEGRRAESNP